MRERSTIRASTRWLCAATLVVICSTPAVAHVGATRGTSGLPFWALLGTSALGGLLGGLGLARLGHRLPSRWARRLERGVHVLVSVIGATIVAPALYAASIPGLAGLAVGSTLAGATIVTVHRRAVTQYVTVVTGSVYAHRAMEGFALAAAYLSGTAVGVVGTLVLTIHATFEIAVVSLGRDGASRRWAFGHAVGIQSTLLVTGALGVSVGSLPDPVRSVVVATAGGVLLVAGMQGLRTDGDANDLAGGAEHG